MGNTFAEKVLMQHSNSEELSPGDIATIEPDRVMSHDNTAFIVKKFNDTGVSRVWNREKIVVIYDHCIPPEKPEYSANHLEGEAFAKEQGIKNFLGATAGVSHQVMVERGFVLPGQIVVGADSHSTLYGALNAFGVPVNRTEMAGIWATGRIWLRVPQSIQVRLEGGLQEGVYSKDVLLKLLSLLRADGAAYKCIEFTGSTVNGLSMSARMTMTNMGVELGAKASVMEFDGKTREFLQARTKEEYEPVRADEDARYERVVELDVDSLEPQVACPHTVDNVKPLSEVAGTRVHQGYLGSCTNGRMEDLEIAAKVLEGRKVAEGTRLVVYPASVEVLREAKQQGVIDSLVESGAQIMTASCGPCFGVVGATLKDNEVCISSSNRNFCGRMGSKKSLVYLSSPAVVAASCIEGKIADPRNYL